MVKIAFDAGHGKGTAGKRCLKKYDKNETREWVLNDRVLRYATTYINEYKDVSIVRLDDPTGTKDVALSTRSTKANNNNVNCVVSFHHNAGGGEGQESFIDKRLTDDSTTAKFAKVINDAVQKATGQKNRGVKKQDFHILRETKASAVLIEFGFMDNEKDTPRILTDDFAKKCARGVVNGLVSYYGLKKKDSTSTGNTSGSSTTTTPKPTTPSTGSSTSSTKYSVGDTVEFKGLATSSTASSHTTKISVKKGKITKIAKGAKYPYLIGSNTGWVNDSLITKKVSGSTTTTTPKPAPTVNYYKAFNNKSFVDGLKSIGVNSSFANRKKIAKANGISAYAGTATQNNKLNSLAKQGKLKKA